MEAPLLHTEERLKMASKKPGLNFLLPAAAALVLVMFILPFYSTPGYSILKNTTSHLGAQHAPNAWIMNLVFTLLGAAVLLQAWLYLKKHCARQVLLTIFGLGLIGTAVFRHAPIVAGIPVNRLADTMHSVFATAVGFSFIFFAVSAAFMETTNRRRISALFIAVIATGLSVLIFTVPGLAGLWQRLMFILAFGWLIAFFEGIKPGAGPVGDT